MIGGLVALFAFIVFLAWPRKFEPPLKDLGEPVWSGRLGASQRYIYSIPGDYTMYAQMAANHLRFAGYKMGHDGFRFFMHPDGSIVRIYPGKWRRSPQAGGFEGVVDTFTQGWVTVSCSLPPDRWRQFWMELQMKFRPSPGPKIAAVSKTSP